MLKPILTLTMALVLVASAAPSLAAYSSGSTGAYGPLDIGVNTTLAMPEDGVFHCTTITIAQGATLTFTKNARNTPVYLLATGDVTLSGVIDVSGAPGTSGSGGRGGPGGFDGGQPTLGDPLPGDGDGPGGGLGGRDCANGVGAGAYSKQPDTPNNLDGQVYGNPLLSTLVGGSGGGGCQGTGGGGGGGAILIASDTKITFTGGAVQALGGRTTDYYNRGGGSGGAIRLVAPVITGGAALDAGSGAIRRLEGRVRVDATDLTGFTHNCCNGSAWSVGSFLRGYAQPAARLDITEIAGTQVPLGSSAVQIELPSGSSALQTITLRAAGFKGIVPIEIVVVPDIGPRLVSTMNFDMSQGDPFVHQTTITLPVDVACKVHAWAR